MTLGSEYFQNTAPLDTEAGPLRTQGAPFVLSSKFALAMVGRVAGASDVVVDAIADVVEVSSAEVVVAVDDSVEDASADVAVSVVDGMVDAVEAISVVNVVPVEAVSLREVSDEVAVEREMVSVVEVSVGAEVVVPVDKVYVSVSVESEDDVAEDEAETLVVVTLGLHGPAMTASAARRATSPVTTLLKEGIAMMKESLRRSKRVIAYRGKKQEGGERARIPRKTGGPPSLFHLLFTSFPTNY